MTMLIEFPSSGGDIVPIKELATTRLRRSTVRDVSESTAKAISFRSNAAWSYPPMTRLAGELPARIMSSGSEWSGRSSNGLTIRGTGSVAKGQTGYDF